MINFIQEANQIKDEIVAWRHAIHQLAEVGLHTQKTASYVMEELKKMGIEGRYLVDGAAVEACIGKGEKCLLLRADYDALPMVEEAKIDFASKNGNSHACGHDMHGANLLGCAKLLKAHEDELQGVVKLLFQPGEETFEGAKRCVEEGILENPKVDSAFAIHVNSQLPRNVFSHGLHPMSSVYGFRIHLKGVGGHGSTPEMCVDPINTGVHIYLALQELVARECAATDQVVLTLGQFNAGTVPNIIPNEATLSGTLRTFSPSVGEYMKKRIHEVVNGVSATYRTQVQIETLSECPALICDETFNNQVIEIIKAMDLNIEETEDGLMNIVPKAYQQKDTFFISNQNKAMASEDFAFISSCVPSGYYLLGAAIDDMNEIYGQHHPKVQFNDEALPLGAAIYASVAMEWFKK